MGGFLPPYRSESLVDIAIMPGGWESRTCFDGG